MRLGAILAFATAIFERADRRADGEDAHAGTGGRRLVAIARAACLCAVAATCWVALATDRVLAQSGAQDVKPWEIVACLDPDRDVIVRVPAGECAGRILSPEEAARLKDERASRMRDAFKQETPREAGVVGSGSGFFIGETRLVTAYHVVDDCGRLRVHPASGEPLDASVATYDSVHDLAVLDTDGEGRGGLVSAIVRTRPVDLGIELYLVGYPTKVVRHTQPQLRRGVTLESAGGAEQARSFARVRMEVWPGDSGSPVLDRYGHVVGVMAGKVNTPKVYAETGELVRHVAVYQPAASLLRLANDRGIPVRTADGPNERIASVLEHARNFVARVDCLAAQ